MHEERPGHLSDLQPQRGQHFLCVAPCAEFIAAEPADEGPAEAPCVSAVALPGGQPCAQVVVALEHGPVHQAFCDLPRCVDDERPVTGCPHAMDPALATAAVMDAGRTEPRSYRQRC